MRIKLLLFVFFCTLFLYPSAGKAQAVATQDSLALVDLYNNTNGPGWINHSNWLTAAPVSTWFGVYVNASARVEQLILFNNKLVGVLPSSLGNLTGVKMIILLRNQLSGTIPSSLGSLPDLNVLELSYNQLSGTIPPELGNLPQYAFVQLGRNQFTFDGMEYLVNRTLSHVYFPSFNPQADIPLNRNGNVYSVTAGGTLSNNTYKWYRDGVLVASKTGDSTYTSAVPGNYGVMISNTVVSRSLPSFDQGMYVNLFSTTNANPQDSLALVDLYNSTNGPDWINNHNWLSQEPLCNWYGVSARFGRVMNLELNENNLTGILPASMNNLTNLVKLNLGNNHLIGGITPVARLPLISSMDLSLNQLSGNLPDSLGTTAQLSFLNLGANRLNGALPPVLGNPAYTTTVYLDRNQFSGSIPVGLSRLRNLTSLSLGGNQLNGNIPDSLAKLSALGSLYLQNNQLSGIIPAGFVNLSNLSLLDLSNNQLSGKIPDSLAKLSTLASLNLSDNQLTGTIPDSLGKLKNLRAIVLSSNRLTGKVPADLAQLPNLVDFYIDHNQFNFDGMETLPAAANKIYSPQAIIPLTRRGNLFSVAAGGALANNTYKLYKDGILNDTKTADSSFAVTLPGQYYITVTNSIATQLTLFTDTIAVSGLRLADSTSATVQTISGTGPVNVVDTPYQSLVLTVTPTPGINALNGEVNFKVTIDPAVTSFNNQAYVQRHYDITPAGNAALAQATVKLYFTQQDFDNFNAAPAHGLDLPAAPTDAAGIANLRVYQYHGFSTTSLPGSYSGNAVEIDPADADILWNAAAQYWEVSFEVTGFSGFFVSSRNNALLPVRLISFAGIRKLKETLLQWTSAGEVNSQYFEVQRSADGNSFTSIGTVRAAGNSASGINYVFSDLTATAPVCYYRLKMIDTDGRFAYSKVIKLSLVVTPALSFYPNPAGDFVTVKLPAVTTGLSTLQLTDAAGRIIQTFILPAGIQQSRLSLKTVPGGIYKMLYQHAGTITVGTLLIR